MEFKGILKKITDEAKEKNKSIILPESSDIRILEATSILCKSKICNVILIGNEDEIFDLMKKNDIEVPTNNLTIIDNLKSSKAETYANELYELRKQKGMTIEKANELMQDNVYFATMMIKQNEADGMVSGAIHSTSDTLRPALQIIKQADNINTVSSFFIIETPNSNLGSNGTYIFSDCGLVEEPTSEQFIDIAKSSANSFRKIVGEEPKLAFLSYSTKGSAKSSRIDEIIGVVNELKNSDIDFEVDGELQLDAAIIPEVAKIKAPDSNVAGKANVLIFPDLEAGNIGYKLVQRFGNAVALGPITQGLRKPVNDLSRGCNAEDVVGAVAITCIQAH